MRTQVALDDEQHARAKQKAAALGITLAEYVRRLVARDLDEATPQGSPEAIIGIGASGGSDVASEGKRAIAGLVAARIDAERR